MGGGDLNLKKSWHPHTMKNQERVWKAEEQAKMEERKLQDLRKEINEERDREELRRLGESSGVLANNGGAAGEAKLEWMYKNSTELINREEYLLGRKIDKSFETLQAEEHRQEQNTVGLKQSINHVEHDCVPFSIRTYRNLQSTEQVDMQRKTLEDPLMLIKQREMESRRKLLENPVKLKEIHRILKTEQDLKASKEKKAKKSKKSKKSKKKKKNKRSSDEESSGSESNDSDDDLDRKLARQVSKLKGDHGDGDLKLDKLLDAKYRTISKQLDMATKKKNKKSKRKSSDSSEQSSGEDGRPRRQRSRELESRRRDKRSRSPEERNHREKYRSRSPQKRRQSRSPEQRHRRRSPEKRKERRRSRSPVDRRERRRSNSPEKRKERRGSRSRSLEKRKVARRSPEKRKERRRSKSPDERNDRPSRTEESSRKRENRRSISLEQPSRSKRSRSRSSKKDERRKSPERPPQRRERERSPAPSRPTGKPKLSEADREARLREMMDNASWREADRSQVVRKHREAYAREEAQNRDRDFDKEFINKEVKKAIANHNSIGDRIRANLNNIQRTSSSMDSNFARK
ncbi:pre-mRNA-splicing factor CWC25 homolog [Drosophila rhopaloa]|uniref:Pre-mRNA-splicing factor CWC25 homolog n=1 Tax=Drosophila rhopaloa TaxID=1041015 RepID=A0A6P4FL38_DRORH|nr:pre-mRNA-splicing factor CWC25 homolog [Drosophila rhopaloa]